jgi:hypothetical protein
MGLKTSIGACSAACRAIAASSPPKINLQMRPIRNLPSTVLKHPTTHNVCDSAHHSASEAPSLSRQFGDGLRRKLYVCGSHVLSKVPKVGGAWN